LKVIFSKEASQDLEAIGDWIAQENPERAFSFVTELRHDCLSLGDFEERNPVYKMSDLGEIRKRVFGSYVVFYIVNDDMVSIARIIHGARNYANII